MKENIYIATTYKFLKQNFYGSMKKKWQPVVNYSVTLLHQVTIGLNYSPLHNFCNVLDKQRVLWFNLK